MDRNTLLGLLMMGAVIFGFMYLNKPSDEEIARQQRERQEQIDRELAKAAASGQQAAAEWTLSQPQRLPRLSRW